MLAGEICFQFILSCNGRVKHEGVRVWVGLEVAKSQVEIVPNKRKWVGLTTMTSIRVQTPLLGRTMLMYSLDL
jgi:hypothetical protein